MTTPKEDKLMWEGFLEYATQISRAIHDHVTETSPTTDALDLFKNRIHCGLESLRVLHRHAKHDFRPDGMTLLRAMYDAQLQALYILSDPQKAKARAQMFLNYRWIEQRRMQEMIERNPTQFAKTLVESPKRQEGEEARERNYQGLRPNYLTSDGKKVRSEWYVGTLRDLAVVVGLESEYEILQKSLSGAVHSTPTALLAEPIFASSDYILLDAWSISYRVLGKIAEHHSVPLTMEHKRIVQGAMRNLFEAPEVEGAPDPR